MKKTNSLVLSIILVLSSSIWAQDSKQATVPRALRSEIEKLKSSEMPKRLEGAFSLGSMGDKAAAAIPFLIAVLHENDGMVDVDKDLMKYFDQDAAFMVFGGKAATINPVQMVASDALVKIGKAALEPLRALLATDPSELPYAYAVNIMARMQDPGTTKALIGMLADQDVSVRSRVVGALQYSKDPAAVEALIGQLNDPEPRIRKNAARALERMTGQSFGEDANKWREWHAKSKSGQD